MIFWQILMALATICQNGAKNNAKIDKYEKTSQKFATFLAKTVQIGKIFGMIAVLLVFLGSPCQLPSPSLLHY